MLHKRWIQKEGELFSIQAHAEFCVVQFQTKYSLNQRSPESMNVRLTTWRSAANAPDGVQNALMMVGAFGSCNGLLGPARI